MVEAVGEWLCTICGERMPSNWHSFGVAQSLLEDKLSIFHRKDAAPAQRIHGACCPAHVRLLVIHWMVTGSLDYPFAQVGSEETDNTEQPALFVESEGGSSSPGVPIGELAIDRDSVTRLLNEESGWLTVILDELQEALELSIEMKSTEETSFRLQESLVYHA